MAQPERETETPIIPHTEPATGTGEAQAARAANPLLRFLKILGPGFITGASDDDPSGIGTYAVAGASLGFATLWMALFTFPLMTTVQYICAKIGLVSGEGLASAAAQALSTRAALSSGAGPRRRQHDQRRGGHRRHRRRRQSAAAASRALVCRPYRRADPRAADLWLLPAHRQHLQMADALPLRLHRRRAVRATGLGGGPARDVYPHLPARRRLPRHPRGDPGHDDLALPLLLAGRSGSGGEDQPGAQAALATAWRQRRRVAVRLVGRQHRHVLLQRRHVFHHPGDRRDALSPPGRRVSSPPPTPRRRCARSPATPPACCWRWG